MEESNVCAPTTVSPRIEGRHDARARLWEKCRGGGASLPGKSEAVGDLERQWRARGELLAFPGHAAPSQAKVDEHRIPELERKIGQQAIEIDFLKKVLRRFREQARPNVGNGGARSTSKSRKQRKRRLQ